MTTTAFEAINNCKVKIDPVIKKARKSAPRRGGVGTGAQSSSDVLS